MQLEGINTADQCIVERKNDGRFARHIDLFCYRIQTAFTIGNDQCDGFHSGIAVLIGGILNNRSIYATILIAKIPIPG